MKQKLIATALCAGLVLAGSTHDVSAATKPSVTKKLTVTVGQSKTIKVKGKSIQSKKFKSNKKSVATVTKKGKVTGKKAGKAKIAVTVKYKKSRKVLTKKYTCTVTVKKKNKAQIQKIVERAMNQMQSADSGVISTCATSADGKNIDAKVSFSGQDAQLCFSGEVEGKNVTMNFHLITEDDTSTIYLETESGCLSTVLTNAKVSTVTNMNMDLDYSTAKLSEKDNTYIIVAKSKSGKEEYTLTIDKTTNRFLRMEFNMVNGGKTYRIVMDMQHIGEAVSIQVPEEVKESAKSATVEELFAVLVLSFGVSLS